MFEGRKAITVDEMAEVLHIGKKTAYALANKPDFSPAFRIGRRLLISVDGLGEWIAQGGTGRRESGI